jgi:hypothetical protein
MGRPPIGERAMTAAEKRRRYRLKHRAGKPEPKHSAPQPARIRELEAELERGSAWRT